MVEATSGPPLARLDYGCHVNPPGGSNDHSYDFDQSDALNYVDPPYTGQVDQAPPPNPDFCARRVPPTNETSVLRRQWRGNSVVSNDYATPSYVTYVNMVYGDGDHSSAPKQQKEWYNAIQSAKTAGQPLLVVGAPHTLPGSDAGVTQIVHDLIYSASNPHGCHTLQ